MKFVIRVLRTWVLMLMDKVTGCAKLYSEFGIMVVRFADEFKKI